MSGTNLCRVCKQPVLWRSGLSTRIHSQCRAKEAAKKRARPERKVPPYKATRVCKSGTTKPSVEVAKGNHRNRKLLDLAHELHTCTACGRYVAEGLEPAHENGIEAGKGASIKGQDHRHAAMCHGCHVAYDTGKYKDDAAIFDRAHKRTFDEYWRLGWIRVA